MEKRPVTGKSPITGRFTFSNLVSAEDFKFNLLSINGLMALMQRSSGENTRSVKPVLRLLQ